MQLNAIRYLTEPYLSQQLAQGVVKVVATSQEVAPGLQHDGIVFGRRLLQQDQDLGRRFMRAYLRGVKKYGEGKTDRNVALISGFTKLPPDIIRQACWVTMSPDGRIAPESVEPLLDWMVETRYMEQPVPRSRWWNPTFVDAAAASMASPRS
jgi:ABC-type nitrate/sulfonate/bicarbonate transport system substrate-binding protein